MLRAIRIGLEFVLSYLESGRRREAHVLPMSINAQMQPILRQFSPVKLFAAAIAVVLLWGYVAPLDRYITPARGWGYTLGIIGGSMMLLLLIYPARKRLAWLGFLGGVPGWFRFHMLLGTLGPLCVLFHANFSLGAANSNVALFCMLTVAGSGVIGRYLYTRIHARLDGGQTNLGELRGIADQLRLQATSVAVVPHLIEAIEAEEARLLRPESGAMGRALHVFTIGARTALARRRLRRLIRAAVLQAAQRSPELQPNAQRLADSAERYAARRLDASRRVAEFQRYARLFSLWHLLHVPLFIMLLIAGTVHVISSEIY
jgi:hypothetical protein